MIYFDNSATTKMAPEALETYSQVVTKIWGNPSSLHKLGDRAHGLLEASRKQVADLLGVNTDEIYFTSGGTESNNTAIKGTAWAKREFGKHIITSSVEHASVANTFAELENLGFRVTRLPVDKEGRVNPEDLKAALDKDTTLVSIMGVNNEIGTIQPIKEISEILADYPNIHFHVDNVQALGKGIWDQVFTSRVDMMSFSSHKFHGPRGIGILYKKRGRMLMPLCEGGGQEKGLRSGTENLAAIAAMAKAARLLLTDEKEKADREYAIKEKISKYLTGKPGIHIFSPLKANFAPHILCFALEGIRGETLVHTLEDQDIYISTTSACASKKADEASTLVAMKTPDAIATSAVRLSFDESNTLEEADEFIAAFDEIYQHFAKINHLGE
ncbi:cysteine desulfurase [Lactobacillus delbrueckii subsp. lactis]|uniref:cysteine desulfurase family protein n=1 Tax=Lactobacillus delbrueckii TaxID=1584 RepID=UPI0001EC30BF|nr:cysteine desulfurase family protein [Lactobacillus delbrueckii]ADQ60704.1 Cysteine sulfinate desulfinase/cysteine desulfurase related enzyme [Lactobacillus delbrueckii subsp. bulgaricus ND02]MBO3081593.1 cysteine desulfurase [Lactobacillus delbrueckii subsp. bulgaricus]MCD5438003.1 cysteine desulfurase [Lactobacillus delbrueckii subsp. lactis]MCD5468559.1 cysteine desulfurase [Lactobacillus delbrueckii subsp. lactis]MCZ0795734.1 cysteine desulfurase family protein [Lactobacillus delbrueckii